LIVDRRQRRWDDAQVGHSESLHPSRLLVTPAGGEIPRRRWATRAFVVLIGLPKTVIFNLRCLPLRQALHLPVLVSHRVALFDLRGSVTIEGRVRTGMVLLGFGEVGAFDFKRERSVWQVAGTVVFQGPARLGNGFKLSVADTGAVDFGPDFVLSAESQLVSRESITFGRGCLISWDVLVLDTDFHPLVTDGSEPAAPQAPIVFGDRVWVGARSSILKGVSLADDTVVAAGSVVARSEPQSNVILGGNPAKVIREGVSWRHS
jgi:acetyltransferase-like isoleucine patch superfamily enzyme